MFISICQPTGIEKAGGIFFLDGIRLWLFFKLSDRRRDPAGGIKTIQQDNWIQRRPKEQKVILEILTGE